MILGSITSITEKGYKEDKMITLNTQYKNWLQTLGFAASSVKSLPNYINEMLHYFEANNINEAKEITEEIIRNFFFQWKNRKNKTTGAGLSQHHINKGALAINKFIEFLNKTGKANLNLKLTREKVQQKTPEVLTQAEIKALYRATETQNKRGNTKAYEQRDKAMLAIYYGCGLRKNEGINIQVSDILQERKLLLVRKGKGNKERFVPITAQNLQDITEYLNYGRNWFLEQRQKQKDPASTENKSHSGSLFVNLFGESMKNFEARINALKEEAGINKKASLHTLRHSIATHLLQSGMNIEQIKKFLGHSSLESTQLYTHIINEL